MDYLGAQIKNREIFCLNYAADLRAFQSLLTVLRSNWERLGRESDTSGRSHVGLLPFSNILVRHSIFGFEHLACYQSFLAWLTFRPGLEALLIIGKLVDDPTNASIWKNKEADFRTYNKTFSGSGLDSKSLPRSQELRQVLGRLNNDFMHPNPNFTYRDATRIDEADSVTIQIELFDKSADIHEAHLLAYLHLIALIISASRDLVSGLCGADQTPAPEDYSQTQRDRAVALATRNDTAKKIMTELGLWVFA